MVLDSAVFSIDRGVEFARSVGRRRGGMGGMGDELELETQF